MRQAVDIFNSGKIFANKKVNDRVAFLTSHEVVVLVYDKDTLWFNYKITIFTGKQHLI